MVDGKVEKTQKLYKPTVEARELAERLFKESGMPFEGDFFAHVMATYELQQMKNGLGTGYQKQISSLEYHMKSVVEHFTSMLQTEESERQELTEGYEGKISNFAAELSAQQEEIFQLKRKYEETVEQSGKYKDEIAELRKFNASIENLNNKNEQILIENKERIEKLSKLVADGQDAINQKQDLEKRIAELARVSEEVKAELEQTKAAAQAYEESVNIERKRAAERHAQELSDAKLRADLEADKALVTLRRELQEELASERANHTAELRKLYADLNSLRQQLSEAAIQASVEQGKKSNKTE